MCKTYDAKKDSPFKDFGALYDSNIDYNGLGIKNTCTIDYFLLALWSSHFFSSKVRYIFNARESEEFIKIVKKIIDLIDMEIPNWNRAKTLWILIINKLNIIAVLCSIVGEAASRCFLNIL